MLHKPTKAEIQAALNTTVPDIIGPDLRILFCGINPSLYSAAVGHHFARPGNRFWKTLHAAGFTDRLFHPSEDQALLQLGYGITNLVDRATATADQLTSEELRAGLGALATKIQRYHPRCLAVLGISAYRTAFGQPKASVGQQPSCFSQPFNQTFDQTVVWVLPNPSGLNAHYQLADLKQVYQELESQLL